MDNSWIERGSSETSEPISPRHKDIGLMMAPETAPSFQIPLRKVAN
jgi:hypothetical protein